VVAVSGHGTVAAYTINYHQWLPGMPPPYAIAIVSLDEDHRVRITSNVIKCPLDEVRVGMRVQVEFEDQGDVWIPLFVPLDEADAPPAADPPIGKVRMRRSGPKFEDDVIISGIGMSDVGRRLMRPPLSLTVDACLEAIENAGLEVGDIDGLATYPGSAPGGMSEGGVTPLEEALAVHPTWISGGGDTPGPTGAVVNAMLAISAGLCNHVLCFRTVWESTSSTLARVGGGSGPTRVSGDFSWRMPYGAASAANWIGMLANRYFYEFGADREMLARIALNARRHASLNPRAVYRDPLSLDDYFDARMISTPFGLYDCDVPSDGAIAVVVSRRDFAHDMDHQPIYVEAVGTQVRERISWDQSTLTHEPQVLGPAAHLWSRTDLTVNDVSVCELYDGFTFNCISWIEGLGFCKIGEAASFIGDGSRLAIGGATPLNTHGGQLSAGRTHGFGFLHEAVTQLRGEGGERQVADARVALVATGGGTPGGCLLLRNE
jgi:acetyl-CoA acetyltransferase